MQWHDRTLIIDNFDSFTWNLVQLLEGLGDKPIVVRSTDPILNSLTDMAPRRLIVSPGPGSPATTPESVQAIHRILGRAPILGVCLGHQCIATAHGAELRKLAHPIHGQISEVTHNSTGLFEGLPNPFVAMRYHSLVLADDTTRIPLRETAWCPDAKSAIVMGIQHETLPVAGVQFHPESFLTANGQRIMENFLSWT
ncbi:MAG: anthranilate synthase component 2 [Planctomycetota bacterium]|jgi:anthranilate synthase component 2